jgi:hypothetical protein
MYHIEYSVEALKDLHFLRKAEQRMIMDEVMKTITVSPRARTVNDLLRQARRDGVILQLPDGERFILTPIRDWLAFEVGDSDDFAAEVQRTAANKELMDVLEQRKATASNRYLSADEVRRELGINAAD